MAQAFVMLVAAMLTRSSERCPRTARYGCEMIQARTKGNPGSKAQSDQADARAASLAPILTKLPGATTVHRGRHCRLDRSN